MLVEKISYTISYDLLKPGQNYAALTERLKQLGGVRILLSTWELKSAATAIDIINDLLRFVDKNDRMIVTGTGGQKAWYNLLITDEQMRKIA